MSFDAEDMRDYKDAQQKRRAERLPIRQAEIFELEDLGYVVKKLTDYQFRINGLIDVYPIHKNYHILKSNKRGTYLNIKTFIQNQTKKTKMNTPKIENKNGLLPTADELIQSELKKFNVSDVHIIKLKEQCLILKVSGVDDAEGYKKVYDSHQLIKTTISDIEKKRKELKDVALKYGRAVDSEAKRITDALEPIKVHLENQRNIVEAEKERLKLEKAKKEQEQFQKRIATVNQYGMLLFGNTFELRTFNETIGIDSFILQSMPEENFERYIEDVKKLFHEEQLRLEEIEKAKKLEEERLKAVAKEQEAEKQRLAKIAQEQEAEKEKLRKQTLELEKQKEEMRKEKIKSRGKELFLLGIPFTDSDHSAYANTVMVSTKEIEQYNEEEWRSYVDSLTIKLAEIKKREQEDKKKYEEQQAQDEINKKKEEALVAPQKVENVEYEGIIDSIDALCAVLEDTLHGKEGKLITHIRKLLMEVVTTQEVLDEMDADMESSGMAQGEIESCLNHWKNKYLIIRK